jgi:uncharacterized protein (DUF362 family)
VRQDLIIFDGLVSLGKYPKKIGLMMGSNDPISCDIVASKIVGRNPYKDALISTAIKESLGSTNYQLLDPQQVFDGVCADFPKLNTLLSGIVWDMQLFMLRTYSRLVGDILPPVLE